MSHLALFASRGLIGWVACAGPVLASQITIPNGSFESPATGFASPNVNSWQKNPKPDWYVESGGLTWDQLAGAFKNTPVGSSDHIGNCDGNQALWIFAVPEMGLFQDYDSTDWANPIPTHAFNAVFEPGKSYAVTVGVVGGGGNMLPGVSLEIGLYYRDAASNHVAVATTSITNTAELFPNQTNLVDFVVETPSVMAGDAWAGQHIGVSVRSTVNLAMQGGYWDIDNVRLAGFGAAWSGAAWSNGVFTATLESKPGLRFEILTSTDPGQPNSNWTNQGNLTNTTGSTIFTDATASPGQRFYQARQLP